MESPPGDEVGASHPVRSHDESRLMNLSRRLLRFTRECEASVSREARDDAILREVEVLVEGSKDVCASGVQCRRRRRNVGSSELQDIMTKYNEVRLRGQENLVWNTDHIEMVELVNLMGQAAQGLHSGEVRHESRRAHDHELPGE